jgi:hypothetical protein
MRTSFFRLFAILLGIGLCSSAVFGQEKEEPKKTPFQEDAESVLGSSAMQLVAYGHLPHFTSRIRLKGGDSEAAFQKRCQRFSDDLTKALDDRESVDHETAVSFLAGYAGMAEVMPHIFF